MNVRLKIEEISNNEGNTGINAVEISKKRQKGRDSTSLSLDILKSLLDIGYSDKNGKT